MAHIYGERQAQVERAADLLRLAVRVPSAAKAYQDFVAGDRALADAATQFIASSNASVVSSSLVISKGSRPCVSCGAAAKGRHGTCKQCRKAYVIGRKKDRVMDKKKIRKALDKAVITKAYAAASGVKTTSRGEAINAMMNRLRLSPDPAEREIWWNWKHGR